MDHITAIAVAFTRGDRLIVNALVYAGKQPIASRGEDAINVGCRVPVEIDMVDAVIDKPTAVDVQGTLQIDRLPVTLD